MWRVKEMNFSTGFSQQSWRWVNEMLHFNSATIWSNRLLNANKINCLRVDAFQDLHNLNLLSLYDNKLQTIAKGTFSPLRAIQTMYVYTIWTAFEDCCFRSESESWVHGGSWIKVFRLCFWKAFGPEPLYLWLPSQVAGRLPPYQPNWDQWRALHQPPASGQQKNRTDQKQEVPLFR